MPSTRQSLNETMGWILGFTAFAAAIYATKAMMIYFGVFTINNYKFSVLEIITELATVYGVYTIQISLIEYLKKIYQELQIPRLFCNSITYILSFIPILGFIFIGVNVKKIATIRGATTLKTFFVTIGGSFSDKTDFLGCNSLLCASCQYECSARIIQP